MAKEAVVAISKTPLSEISPPADTVRLLTERAPRSNAVETAMLISLPVSVVKVTVPAKILALFERVISASIPSVLSSTVLPPTLTTPDWVMVPALSTLRLPVAIDTVPSTKSLASSIETLFAPILFRLTAPVKSFAKSRVIALAPEEKLDTPLIVDTPLWVIPLASMVKSVVVIVPRLMEPVRLVTLVVPVPSVVTIKTPSISLA